MNQTVSSMVNQSYNFSFEALEKDYLLAGKVDYIAIVQNLCEQVDIYIIQSHDYYIKVIIIILIMSFLVRLFPKFRFYFPKYEIFEIKNLSKTFQNFILKYELNSIGGKYFYPFERILNISYLVIVVRILYVWSYLVTFKYIELWVKLEYIIYVFYIFWFIMIIGKFLLKKKK